MKNQITLGPLNNTWEYMGLNNRSKTYQLSGSVLVLGQEQEED